MMTKMEMLAEAHAILGDDSPEDKMGRVITLLLQTDTLRDLEIGLFEKLFPELRNPTTNLDRVRIASAITIIHHFTEKLLKPFSSAYESQEKRWQEFRAKAKGVVDEFNQLVAANNELSSQLRQAREQTGMFANPRIEELEKRLAAAERETAELNDALREKRNENFSLRNQLMGSDTRASGYERDITQLTTAAAGNAAKARAATKHIAEAQSKLKERWPGPNPFVARIVTDLERAQKELA